jgi:hypothetical protein
VGLENIMSLADDSVEQLIDEKRSYFHIEFEGEGSARFTADLQNITPMQMLALAAWMEFEAKHQLSMEKAAQFQQRLQQEQMQGIAIPGKDDLRKLQ